MASDQQSANTLLDYCTTFDIILNVLEDAESAISHLQQTRVRYELLIVEPENMQGMGAYAFCSWFKQNEAQLPGCQQALAGGEPPAAVIVLSAQPKAKADSDAFGADGIVFKPLSPMCFAAAIMRWIKGRQQRRKAQKASAGASAPRPSAGAAAGP